MGDDRKRLFKGGRKRLQQNQKIKNGKRKLEKVKDRLLQNRVLSVVYDFIGRASKDDLLGVAAQTAFFLLLSVYPLILLLVSSIAHFSLNVDTELISLLFPKLVVDIIESAMQNTVPMANITVVSIIVSVWSASAAIWALMKGICISYTGRKPESFIRGRLISMVFMVGFMAAIIVSLVLWVFGQTLVEMAAIYIPDWENVLNIMRHGIAILWIFIFILGLYNWTPGFDIKKRNMIVGALVAAIGWTVASWGFEVYMRYFSRYTALYGGVGVFLGLAVWLFIISIVILLGAEVNAILIAFSKHKKKR